MGNLVEALPPVAIFVVGAYIVRMILEYKTRNKLIEKGIVDESIQHLFQNRNGGFLSSLKWGMVLVGVGIAFLLGQFFPDLEEGVTISSAFILAGVALLIFYSIEGKMRRGA